MFLRYDNMMKRRRKARVILLGCSLCFANGCASVSFYEKARLVDPLMAFNETPAEMHFYQKTFYAREGSAGGIGTTAGGGCGCY